MKVSNAVLLLILCIAVVVQSISATPAITVLVIYTDPQEQVYFQNLITTHNTTGMNIIYRSMESVQSAEITTANAVFIFASDTQNPSIDLDAALKSFLAKDNTTLGIYTSDFSEFDDEQLLSIMGVGDIHTDYKEANITWTVQVIQSFGQTDAGSSFKYNGGISIFDPVNSASVLANITDYIPSKDVNDENFPAPILMNTSTAQHSVILSGMGLFNSTKYDGLHISSLVPWYSVIDELVRSSISNLVAYAQAIQKFGDGKSSSSDDVNPTNSSSQYYSLANFSPITLAQLLSFLLAAFALIFWRRLLGFLRWLYERGFSRFLLIVGAFYKIQNRQLRDNSVLLNPMRQQIFEYIQYKGAFGAYFRELKAQLETGTGALLWHLQVLNDFELIEKVNIGNSVVFVSTQELNSFDSSLKHIELSLQSKYTLIILEYILSHIDSPINFADLVNDLGENRRGLLRQLKKLASYNLLQLQKTGKSFTIIATNSSKLEYLLDSFKLRDSFSLENNDVKVAFAN